VHLYLCGEGDNKPFSDGLKLAKRHFEAPKRYPLATFERTCGPEEGMKWQIDEAGFNRNVENIMARYREGNWDMPPLIIQNHLTHYELNDGNHRYEALKRMGIDTFPVIIWETVNES